MVFYGKVDELLEVLTGRGCELSLDRASLQLARIEHPGLDIRPFVELLDSYAEELRLRIGPRAGGLEYIAAANEFLFEDLGFSGNTSDYYNPQNSCLNDVLTSRLGIPITLSVLYMEVARRLKRPVRGVGLPGHFLVQYNDGEVSVFVDPFHGGAILRESECFSLAAQATGRDVAADRQLLTPVSSRRILIRMLANLRGVYLRRNASGKALKVLDLLVASSPDSSDLYRDRFALHLQLGNPGAARSDLETCLRLEPAAADREDLAKKLAALRQYIARMN